ncbi:MAG: ABC transporter permease/substrate-binding protein [Myxococcales bacterium]|nr:ABC transporter permease/substrate-binding protein [Myxococcales bacterium]USN49788.1 MAG: ABC transporter permease/substrate-binding protein [Myxococcales bacterium]
MIEQLRLLPEYLSAHLNLTLTSLSLGILISVPLGILAARFKPVERIALGIAQIIQTIPSLALLAAMVPLLALLGAHSIGYLPAFIALVLYSILPILRNTVVGLRAVDPAFIEAAKGVGMTRAQRLFRVELPLATPMIIAGIRTSTTLTVGTATLSTPVGATSLGNYIFVGLQTQNIASITIGCIAAAVLAVGLDTLVRVLAYGLEREKKSWVAGAFALFALLFSYVVYDAVKEYWPSKNQQIVIGAKAITEQYILSEILKQKIENQDDCKVKIRQSLSSLTAYEALKANEIDVFVEYSATLWNHTMQMKEHPLDSVYLYQKIEKFLNKDGVELVGKIGFKNNYAFAIKRELAKKLGIENLSDLAQHSNLILAGDYEFFGRPEWQLFKESYKIRFSKKIIMDHALVYQAADKGNVDVIVVFTTDGHIDAHDMLVLEDDKNASLSFDAMILTSKKFGQQLSKLNQVLKNLVGTIDEKQIRDLNFKVDGEGQDPAAVARIFNEEKNSL